MPRAMPPASSTELPAARAATLDEIVLTRLFSIAHGYHFGP